MLAFKIISILLLIRPLVFAYNDYDDLSEEDDEYYVDYYEAMPAENDSSNRAKRYQDKTMSLEEIGDVKGALQELLPNIEADSFTSHSTTNPGRIQYFYDELNITTTIYSTFNTQVLSDATVDDTGVNITYETNDAEEFKYILTTEDHFKNESIKATTTPYPTSLTYNTYSRYTDDNDSKQDSIKRINDEGDYDSLRSLSTSNDTLDTTPTTYKSRELDIPRLLAIIADLASEYETNLTRKLNETLFNMSIPTCTTPTTEPPTTSEYDANYTGATIAKCFVCGLDIPGIPRHAQCADAFAGDFLPLVPVDASAKGKISTYRKYCKYSNIPGFVSNMTHSRAIYGRWTGGCAVRWIDLSGIYTQRTCRSRLQPSMGKHFASKRMAKLERSLWNVDNGCIISPVATLVPLSRSISLYARFHACVCTGNWCNAACVTKPWTSRYYYWLMSMLTLSIFKIHTTFYT